MNSIEKLHMILLAIEKVERMQNSSSLQIAENLDALYTALKSQAKELILEHKLTGEKNDVQH